MTGDQGWGGQRPGDRPDGADRGRGDAPQPPTYGAGGYGAPPPGAPLYGPAGYGYPAPQIDQSAVWALVLAICSFVVCPVLPAIAALVLAANAERSIAASGGWRTGEGLARAARIVAWLNIGLVLAVMAFAVLSLLLLVGSTSP